MKASKLLSLLTACILTTCMSSCAINKNENESSDNAVHARPTLYTAFAAVPEDKFYIPLYSQQDTASGGITPIYLNDKLEVIGESGDWCEVRCKGYIGFLQKEFLSSEELPEVERTTKAKTTSTTTTTAASTAEDSSSTTAEGDKDSDKNKDKDKDKDKDKNKDKDKTERTTQGSTESETTTASETEATTQSTAPLPASAYPDVTYSLDINEVSPDSDKYDITLTLDGRYTRYVYELHRIFADGTDKVIANGESEDTHIKLATVNLTSTQTIDRLIVTAYFNSVAGNQITLDLKEPTA